MVRPERLAWACVAAFLALGTLVTFLGLYVRPVSDDYRLTVWAREGGPVGTAMIFYSKISGRVGNGFLEGFVYLTSWGPKLTALLSFAVLAASVAFLVHELLRRSGIQAWRLVPWFAGLGVAAVAHLDQPRHYHTLFWATGAITHVLPPALLACVIAIGLRVRSARARRNLLIALVPAGLFIATISEPITLAWFVLAGLCFVTHVLFVRRVTYALTFTGALSLGFVAGALVVLTSPGHAKTREVRGVDVTLFSQQIFADTFTGWGKAIGHFLTNPSLLAALAVGVIASVLVGRCARPGVTRARMAWAVFAPVISVLATALLVMWALRVGWGAGGWAIYRGWFIFTFLAVLTLAWLGFLLGQYISQTSVSVAACIVVMAATLTYVGELNTLGQRVVTRAVAWDKLDSRVRRDIRNGKTVVEYKNTPIAELSQPFSGRGWVAKTVATYYGVDRVVEELPREAIQWPPY